MLGSEDWGESYAEDEITFCKLGGTPEKHSFPKVDSVLTEMEAFADAVEGIAPYPVPQDQILQNVSVLEAVFEAAESGETEQVKST